MFEMRMRFLIVITPPSILMRRGTSRMRQRKTRFAGCSGIFWSGPGDSRNPKAGSDAVIAVKERANFRLST